MSDDKSIHNFETLDIAKVKLAIISSKFNNDITEKLKKGAIQAFLEQGGQEEQLSFYEVPGAFELPLVAKRVAKTKKYDAILCLGAIIKGETAHFEYVASATIQGINRVSIETEIPILSGVLTTLTLQQAKDRASEQSNIGRDYMLSSLDMIQTLQTIGPC